MSDPRGYREDLDTLRALAVGLVLIFHFDLIPGVAGGFLGVDVFFVISGYIITRKNLPSALNGQFSIGSFWVARVRRLAPALVVTLLATLVVAWFYYLPSQLVALAKQSLATQVYAANLYYWQTVNYFGLQAKLVPLLHTWSLAVEEQFYIFYPLLFLLGRRLGARGFFIAIAVLTLMSFGLCLALAESKPEATFYLAPTRMWELGVGCLLAVAEWHRQSTSMIAPAGAASRVGSWAFLGCLAIVVGSAAYYHSGIRTPGVYSLLPVAGTVGLVAWGSSIQGLLRRVWLNGLLRYLGRVSYPLYLTHWPIHVMAKDMLRQDYTWETRVGCALLSLLTAMAIHEWAEKPIAALKGLTLRRTMTTYALVTLGLSGLCVAMIVQQGFPQRFSNDVLSALQGESDRPPLLTMCIPERDNLRSAYIDKRCLLGDATQEATVALLGDSHAWAANQAVSEALRAARMAGRLTFYHACPPILGVHLQDGGRDDCHQHNARTFDWVIQNARIDTVILASTWIQGRQSLTDNPLVEPTPQRSQALFRDGLLQTVQALKKAGKKVYLIGPVPAARYPVPLTLARNIQNGRPVTQGLAFSAAEHRERFAFFSDAMAGVRPLLDGYFDPATALCTDTECKVELDKRPLYFDDDHLSNLGRGLIEPGLRQMLAAPPR